MRKRSLSFVAVFSVMVLVALGGWMVGRASPFPTIDGIACDQLANPKVHFHVHLDFYYDGYKAQIPSNIGVHEPTCTYWIHTHANSGIIHVESPISRDFTLGDLFKIWGEPLTSNKVGQFSGSVLTYVDGELIHTSPGHVLLHPHDEITLEIGNYVSPASHYSFPPGE